MSQLANLQSRLNYNFRNLELLRLSLTHPSVAHEAGGAAAHNQRLEFLGDAVLQLALSRALYEKFPDFDEGALTKARAKMVNQNTLAEQARRLQLGECLILSKGEDSSGGRLRPSILADAFEAVLGAIFLDGGFEVARDFVLNHFSDAVEELDAAPNLANPKGELQELLQAKSQEAPEYQLLSVSGPDHDRLFECAVSHQGVELGRGTGKSKKAAESQAALVALQNLRHK